MKRTLKAGTLTAIGLVVALLIANAAFSYRNMRKLDEDAVWVAQNHEVLDLTGDLVLTLMDADMAQRGFLITKQEEYLASYQAAVANWQPRVAVLMDKTSACPRQQDRIVQLKTLGDAELATLAKGVEMRRRDAKAQRLFDIATKSRKQIEVVRGVVNDMRKEEALSLAERQEETAAAYRLAVIAQLLATLLGLCVVVAFAASSQRTLRVREKAAAAIRQGEMRLRMALAAAHTAVWEWDPAQNQFVASESFNEVFGLPPGSAVDDRNKVFALIHPDDHQQYDTTLRTAFDRCESYVCQFRITRPDNGALVWLEERGHAVCGPSGKTERLLGVVTDIDDRKRTEDALKEADQKKNEFLAMLAHELRNPLAPIRNALHIMRMDGASAQSLAQVRDMMNRQVDQLVRLVDDLLDVSRITRGKLELRRERIGVTDVVDIALETTRPLIEAADHDLAVSMPAETMALDGDLTRLAQVLSNLLSNAAKYTTPGGKIWLTVGKERGDAVLSVRDTGIGIAPDMLPQVFEMFTQANRNVGRAQGGLGIGLTLVRRLVDMHGGTVEAKSEGLDKGSEFIVRLPLATSTADQPEVPGATANNESRNASRRRILVVDDNTDSAESLSLLLQIMGNEVQTAIDGPSALEAARNFRPEMVLLDIGLPGMSGYEVARRMRLMPDLKNALLVAQTGWGQDDDRRRSAAAGFDAHLVKPVDQAALKNLVMTMKA